MIKSRLSGGRLELIVGPMFSGKSETLILRVNEAISAYQRVIAFKSAADVRYDCSSIVSHSGQRAVATAVVGSTHIRDHLKAQRLNLDAPLAFPDVVAIDEVQFFDGELIRLVVELEDSGVRVVLAGLDLDFKGAI